jgi:hypothetical protein
MHRSDYLRGQQFVIHYGALQYQIYILDGFKTNHGFLHSDSECPASQSRHTVNRMHSRTTVDNLSPNEFRHLVQKEKKVRPRQTTLVEPRESAPNEIILGPGVRPLPGHAQSQHTRHPKLLQLPHLAQRRPPKYCVRTKHTKRTHPGSQPNGPMGPAARKGRRTARNLRKSAEC